jgi:hypothetical protein
MQVIRSTLKSSAETYYFDTNFVLTYSEIRCKKSLKNTNEISVPISTHSALNGKYTLLCPQHTTFMEWKVLSRTSAPELLI